VIKVMGPKRQISCDIIGCNARATATADSADSMRAQAHERGWDTVVHPSSDRSLDLCKTCMAKHYPPQPPEAPDGQEEASAQEGTPEEEAGS